MRAAPHCASSDLLFPTPAPWITRSVPVPHTHVGGLEVDQQTYPSLPAQARLQKPVPYHATGTPVSPQQSRDGRAPNQAHTIVRTTRWRRTEASVSPPAIVWRGQEETA